MYKTNGRRNGEPDAELFRRFRDEKDESIRNEIVSRYMYLAEILAKKFINRGVDYDDIYQVACIALIHCYSFFYISVCIPLTTCQNSIDNMYRTIKLFINKNLCYSGQAFNVGVPDTFFVLFQV